MARWTFRSATQLIAAHITVEGATIVVYRGEAILVVVRDLEEGDVNPSNVIDQIAWTFIWCQSTIFS